MKLLSRIILWTAILSLAACKTADRTFSLAHSYFNSLATVLQQDAGNLWGVDLYAPTFFTDPETKIIYADRADNEGMLEPSGQIWTGQFPEQMNPANSTAQLGGMRWVMALWPLPEEAFDRNILLVHETFHYRQPELQLDPNPGICSHMETLPARIWLKTEWNALDAAVSLEDSAAARDALLDALRLREARLRAFPREARINEDAFLILEGLPEYTAYKICCDGTAHMKEQVIKSRIRHWDNESFVYAFAYHSGLTYGYLLDRYHVSWRDSLKKDASLPDMLYRTCYPGKDLSSDPDSVTKQKYGYDTVAAAETEKEREKARIMEAYLKTFTADTILAIRLGRFNMGFSPVNVQSMGDLGTLYPNIRITGDFGILEVTGGGCLISADWTKAFVPYHGDGWTLDLEEGYLIVPPVREAPLVYRIAEM